MSKIIGVIQRTYACFAATHANIALETSQDKQITEGIGVWESICQELAKMPDCIKPDAEIYVFTIPVTDPLGTNDSDFSNVNITSLDVNQDAPAKAVDPDSVLIVSKGRLGTLPLGFLHIEDKRERLSTTDVQKHSEEQIKDQLERKRTGCLC